MLKYANLFINQRRVVALFTFPILLILLSSLTSCMTVEQYRYDASSTCLYKAENDCSDKALTKALTKSGNAYYLNFVEFDDQGYLLGEANNNKPSTADVVLESIEKIVNEHEDSGKSLLLITFVHGWHHNASGRPEDDNIVSFREKILEKAADSFSENTTVIGLYIGWRGDSFRVPLLDKFNLVNTFSFWERKKTAHEIGSQGMTSFLLSLEQAFRSNTGSRNKMITIGHSFGAAALYSGISHVLQDRMMQSLTDGKMTQVDGYGDMVVLLNPAFEGIKHSSLFELSQNNCLPYSKSQLPRLVIISSAADLAVRWAFPTGRHINAIFETHGHTFATHCTQKGAVKIPLSTSDTDRYAVGHNCRYITHDLWLNSGEIAPSKVLKCNGETVTVDHSQTRYIASTLLTKRDITMEGNPIYNIWTNREIIKGHNDIWEEPISNFVYQMVKNTTMNKSF